MLTSAFHPHTTEVDGPVLVSEHVSTHDLVTQVETEASERTALLTSNEIDNDEEQDSCVSSCLLRISTYLDVLS